MPRGYVGKFLLVNLSKGTWNDFTVAESILKDYLGGSSLAAKLFFDKYPLDADPLSEQNPLMIMTGPMVGSGFPGTSRFSICAKAPQTGIWGESACGGTFGPELKRAGYDGIVFEGKSPSPVTLSVVDGKVELLDASSLWGRDVYESTDLLREKDAKLKVLTIGQAGENLVKIAAIGNDKGHFSGRTGLGAVMGSKKLKAIVVTGDGKIPIANPELAEKL
ncbi:MAG TPA: aldehyde ferredoxin oxidoreductase N-terminal domain-containing protein, partial [Desulfomonilia bacterium]|nr:aldehyde ferredoxin oxidoreductase N-terminal domain-containing protein [Desulfomonilia bacterium]